MSFLPSEALRGQALKTPHLPGGEAGPSLQGLAGSVNRCLRPTDHVGVEALARVPLRWPVST